MIGMAMSHHLKTQPDAEVLPERRGVRRLRSGYASPRRTRGSTARSPIDRSPGGCSCSARARGGRRTSGRPGRRGPLRRSDPARSARRARGVARRSIADGDVGLQPSPRCWTVTSISAPGSDRDRLDGDERAAGSAATVGRARRRASVMNFSCGSEPRAAAHGDVRQLQPVRPRSLGPSVCLRAPLSGKSKRPPVLPPGSRWTCRGPERRVYRSDRGRHPAELRDSVHVRIGHREHQRDEWA